MNVTEKAMKLARGGNVTHFHKEGDLLSATVEGEHGTYKVSRDPEGWTCECPAYQLGHRMCSHIGAVGLYEKWGPVYEAERRAQQRMERRNRP